MATKMHGKSKMDAATIIEQVYGFWFVILGTSLITAKHQWQKVASIWIKHPEQLAIVGVLLLPIGLFTILIHNIWSGLSILVTLMGWIVSIKSTLILCFPKAIHHIGSKVVSYDRFNVFGALIYFVLAGLILVGAYNIY